MIFFKLEKLYGKDLCYIVAEKRGRIETKSKLFLGGIIAFALIFPINMSMQAIYAMNSTENDNSKFASNWEKTDKGYRYTDGYPKNTIENIDGSWYYFDQDGYRVTGWEKIENHWYYFDEDGKKVVSQWIGDYYVDEEGIMAADTWIGNDHVNKYGLKDDTAGWKHDGKGWWYLNAGGGYPKSTWKQVDGTWYYFNDKGYMITGWLKQGATWYYLKPNGAMAKGWDYINKKWYYFAESGSMKASTWIDGLYYVKADGSMAANEYVQGYWLDKNGKWSYKPRASWKKNSKGWWYEDTTGWYPRNATYIIDGKRCVFDVNGYLWDLTQANNVLNKIGRNLRAAYNWSTSLTYWRQSYSPNMGTRWYANIGFTMHKGNCYVMAGTFTEMARALGYNAHQVVGYVPHRGGGDAPHSWVEIDEADGTWVYDPNLTNEKGLPAFHFKYGKAKTWRYYKYHRVN